MRDNLERIRVWLERKAPHLASSLQPGLTLDDMRRIMGPKSARYRIADEVVKLYEWRNGQAENLPFFDRVRFQPFEEAVEHGNLAERHFDGVFPLLVFRELDDYSGYEVRCETAERRIAPPYRFWEGGERIETPSLAELLGAVAEGFEAGAFRPNDQGELDTEEDVWNSILLRHNPERTLAVNALLQRRWAELSGETLQYAIFDLAGIDETEAIAVIREYLHDNSERHPEDFDPFFAALSTGVRLEDEWTRDYALSLTSSHTIRMREAALVHLAWSWHGQLPLTAQHVDMLIDQMLTIPETDSCNCERAMLLGVSGDRRAVPALLRLLNEQSPGRDTWIAAVKALGRLRAVEASRFLLDIAESDWEPGLRLAAVQALVDSGFEHAPVEAAAKACFREMLREFGSLIERLPEQDRNQSLELVQDGNQTLKRWERETKQSLSGASDPK